MQITLPRAALVEDLRLAERLLPVRSPEPALRYVLLRAGGRGTTLLATDRELSLWLDQEAVVERPGSALLPLRHLLPLLRESEAETLRLELADGVLRLRAGGLTGRLRSPDPADFPAPAPFPPRAHALLPAEPLRQAIRRTLFAAANEPGCCLPYLLEAVLCELGRDRLRLVASDNRRLAAADVPVQAGGFGRPRRLLMSVRALALLGRLARDESGPVRAFFGPPAGFFRLGRATFAARLLRGQFPDWDLALPADGRRVAELPAGALLAAVRQAAVLRERVQPRVLLRLEPGRLLLESSQSGVGSARVEQAAEYAAEPLAVAFNPAFLLDLLRSLEPDVTLRLELSGADGPAVFSTADGYRHVLMPLRAAPARGSAAAPEPVFGGGRRRSGQGMAARGQAASSR